MSRPQKNNADWFSHDTNLRNHRVIKVARNKFGERWYSVFCMFLEHQTDSDDFKVLFNATEKQVIAADFWLQESELQEIIDFYIEFELLQKDGDFVYSQHLIDRMQALLNKRRAMREKYTKKPAPHDSPPKEPDKPKPKPDTMSQEDFERFWAEYPKKEDKKKAMKKFLQLKSSLLPIILDAIKRNKAFNRKWKEGYIKNPLTWINGENWNDEIQTQTTNETHSPNNTWKISSEWSADDVV